MSFITDHIRKIDTQLDGLQLAHKHLQTTSLDDGEITTSNRTSPVSEETANQPSQDISRLQTAVKALSTASTSRTLLPPSAILALLSEGGLLGSSTDNGRHEKNGDLEWLLVSKATNQTYGLVLSLLLDQTIPLSSDIEYWNEVLGAYRYMALYSIQTSPIRLWRWTKDVYGEASSQFQSMYKSEERQPQKAESMSEQWRIFYSLIRNSIRQRSLADIQTRFMSPITISQLEARSKRRHVRRVREMSGSGIGILVDEGMVLDTDDGESVSSRARSDDKEEWKSVVWKSVSLMEAVLRNVTSSEIGPGDFEETVFVKIDEESSLPQEEGHEGGALPPTAQIAQRLKHLLDDHIPSYMESLGQARASYGVPSRLVRYWLPAAALLLSSSTILRILVHRKAAIVQWVQDFSNTARDFWYNWIVEPVKKIVGTIRHDKDSEIALMSKESLQGDQASLERMVTDFAIDNPEGGVALTDAQIASVRAKVKEGDLTPVLKAYEKDLRKPFAGTIRGDLIRALLIQIQKTKVDVEVAIGGIDNLLKSQELVFGFVGITPSLLICIAAYRWLGDVFSGRQGRSRGQKKGSLLRILRNVDRILTAATPASNGMLSYKERGMLLCEVHVLRQRAAAVLPREVNNDFLEEVHELIELRTGVDRQLRVVERIRWAYAKYLY